MATQEDKKRKKKKGRTHEYLGSHKRIKKKRGRCRANFFIPFNDFYALALDDDDDFQKTTCEEEEEEEGRGLSGGCSLSLFLFLSFFLSFCFLSVAIFS